MCFTWQLFSLFGTSPPSFPNLLHFLSLPAAAAAAFTTVATAADRFCIPLPFPILCFHCVIGEKVVAPVFVFLFLSFQEPLSFTCCIVLFCFGLFSAEIPQI